MILMPGRRTVTAALRAIKLAQEKRSQNHHRVLNRAVWSSRRVSQTLPRLLVQALAPSGPIFMGIGGTLERRRGDKIAAKGIYLGSVRSSHGYSNKSSGFRGVSLMLLAPVS